MTDRAARLAASRAELASLGQPSIAEVVPSRRDFTQYLSADRRELATLARLDAAAEPDIVERAKRYDDAEVAALILRCDATHWRQINAAVSAPLLRDNFAIAPSQIYHSRLLGADAVLLPTADLDAAAANELSAIAASLHMTTVMEISSRSEMERALGVPRCVLALSCVTAGGGADVGGIAELARQVPGGHAVIVLDELRALSDCDSLRGLVDAVTASVLLHDAGDLAARIAEIAAGTR
jgi:indole-3-glycerol phosphate synthase